jgi:hypothetical protein
MRADDDFASEVWGAITGGVWIAPDGIEWGYTYRAAGDIVAAITGLGDYCRYYCSVTPPETMIRSDIAKPMLAQGWRWRPCDWR